MIPARIFGSNRVMTTPKGWDRKLGEIHELPIIDERVAGLRKMTSAWAPTPEDLRRLNEGGMLYLTVMADSHPAVWLHVKKPPYA